MGWWGSMGHFYGRGTESRTRVAAPGRRRRRRVPDGRTLALFVACEGVDGVGVEEIRTSGSAARAAFRNYIVGGGRGEEGTVSLPRRTDKLDAGRVIVERILSCVGIIAGPYHAIWQTVNVLAIVIEIGMRKREGNDTSSCLTKRR
jgi:hypothetical protein